MGDVNLCSLKWKDPDYNLYYIAEELLWTRAQCGLISLNIGNKNLAGRLNEQGELIESAIDHVYFFLMYSSDIS